MSKITGGGESTAAKEKITDKLHPRGIQQQRERVNRARCHCRSAQSTTQSHLRGFGAIERSRVQRERGHENGQLSTTRGRSSLVNIHVQSRADTSSFAIQCSTTAQFNWVEGEEAEKEKNGDEEQATRYRFANGNYKNLHVA